MVKNYFIILKSMEAEFVGGLEVPATYRLRGVTLVPDPYSSPNTATGTFVLDASGTANPYTSK